MTPKFKHDCKNCQLLAVQENTDWYYCPREVTGATIVGRMGDEPSQYWSMPIRVICDAVENKHNKDLGAKVWFAYGLAKCLA